MHAMQAPRIGSDTNQLLLFCLSIYLCTVTAMATCLRLQSRFLKNPKILTEDVLKLLGALCAIGMSAAYAAAAYYGYGKHVGEIMQRPSDIIVLDQLSFAIPYLYLASAFLVKMSFIALHLRLNQGLYMRWTKYSLAAIFVAQTLAAVVVHSWAHIAPSEVITGSGSSGSDIWASEIVRIFWNVFDIVTITSSAAMYIVPMWILPSLPLLKSQIWGMGVIFGTMICFLVVATCVKTIYAWSLIPSTDIYYKAADIGIYAQLEVHILLVRASTPKFIVLLRNSCRYCKAPPNPNISLQSFYPSAAYASLINAERDEPLPRRRPSSWRAVEARQSTPPPVPKLPQRLAAVQSLHSGDRSSGPDVE